MMNRFDDLPDELFLSIINNLNAEDASNAARVSTRFARIVRDRWERRTDKHFPDVTQPHERTRITNWPQHFISVESKVYAPLTAKLRRLFYLVKEKNVSSIMQESLDVNELLAVDTQNKSLLSLAAKSKDQQLLNHLYKIAIKHFILFNDIDPDKQDREGHTIFHWAIYCNQGVDAITALLEHGCELDRPNIKGKTPLMIAVETRQYDLATLLLDRLADPIKTDRKGRSALIIAVENNYPEMIHLLIGYGSSTLQTLMNNVLGQKPICLAAQLGHIDALQALLAHERIDAVDGSSGKSALHFAAEHGQIDTMLYLLANGADINATDDERATPLHLAIRNGKEAAAVELLKHHADVNAKTWKGSTVLLTAVLSGNINLVSELYNSNADTSADNLGATLLYTAAEKGDTAIVEFLLSKGMDIDQAAIDGRTALYIAVRNNHFETAKHLLQHCANPNVANKYGITPLYVAARKGNLEMTKLLLQYYANPERATYGTRKTAYVKALECGHTQVADEIIKYSRGISLFKNNHNKKKLAREFSDSAINVPRLFNQYSHQPDQDEETSDSRYIIDL